MQTLEWELGKKYGELTTTGNSYVKSKHRYVEFSCNCGTIKWIRFDGVKSGMVRSCGCVLKEVARSQMSTHGLSSHPLYNVHEDMKARCLNPNCLSYENYGGRGINICREWVDDFKAFYDWSLDNGWYEGCGLTLDREDNELGYTPANCRWVTDFVQSRNKRSNVWLTIFGETRCITDWALDERCKVGLKGFAGRIKRGWNAEDALLQLSRPPKNKMKKRLIP